MNLLVYDKPMLPDANRGVGLYPSGSFAAHRSCKDLLMTESVREAQLERTEAGLIPQGEGWFVLNARDVSWIRSEERGQDKCGREAV